MVRIAQLVRTIPAATAAGVGVAAPPRNALVIFETLEAFIARLQTFATASAVAPGLAFPWPELERMVERVVDALEVSNDLFWIATSSSAPPDLDYLARHQARVTVMAVRVGANLGWSRRDLVALGVAGCLFDFGLLGISDSALRAAEDPRKDVDGVCRDHPRRAAALIRGWNPPYPSLLDAVLQHHEREHGQGYPQGLEAAAIHPHAKVLGLVDQYTRLTVPPVWQPAQAPHEAVRDIVRFRHDAFPTGLIKALLVEVSVFPPGTTVRLNTGETGSVVGINREQPLRPRLTVITDAKGHPLPQPRDVDLSSTPFLFITRATGVSR